MLKGKHADEREQLKLLVHVVDLRLFEWFLSIFQTLKFPHLIKIKVASMQNLPNCVMVYQYGCYFMLFKVLSKPPPTPICHKFLRISTLKLFRHL